jgi:hypothetical protein
MNHKILAALANSKFKESAPNIRKPKNEITIVEENSVDATDAYSYVNDTKKGSTKVRTQESTTDQIDEIQTQGTIYDKIQAETHHSLTKPQKRNSFTNNTSEDLNDEEKLYGSEGLVNEYNENLGQDFESPIDHKATGPSPHPNTSAMSKEVGLDDRTSRIKEEEDLKIDSTDFPLTAAKTIIHYGQLLSEYEESEILNYMVIYYINKNLKSERSARTLKSNKKQKKDPRGEIKVIKGEHLAYRYEIIESLGKGAFGEVIKCFDHKEKEEIAIKVLK